MIRVDEIDRIDVLERVGLDNEAERPGEMGRPSQSRLCQHGHHLGRPSNLDPARIK